MNYANEEVKHLTKLEQLEYLINFYKNLMEDLKKELAKVEEEFQEEMLVRQRKNDSLI